MILLRPADEEDEASSRMGEGGCDGQDLGEALDGAEGHDVVGLDRLRRAHAHALIMFWGRWVRGVADREAARKKIFGSRGYYIDIRQCKGAGDFAKEGGLFVVGFDQRHGDLRRPEFDGDAGKSGARADVGEADFRPLATGVRLPAFGLGRGASGVRYSVGACGVGERKNRASLGTTGFEIWSHTIFLGEQLAGGEKGFAEVAGDDLFWIADGGEIDAGVPADE